YHDSVSAYRNYSDEFYCFGEFGGIIPLSYQKARRRKRRIAKETDVKEIRLHDFRHSCASLLINSGATVTLVSKYMGHANVTETLNTYSHLFKSDLQNISSLIDKIQKDA
ncbi:MAG: tyrosine-type recombinase/integrase, partial [bacterium]|nr:tyrosine-type recombinase/integrase [bacterium]